MQIQVLDLDGSIPAQQALVSRCQPAVADARDWGPRIRLGCSFRHFRQFEDSAITLLDRAGSDQPRVVLFGSGDFHHVTLALLRRLREPCNLLVLDNHPDWMRCVPLLHCGTWVYHAAGLPGVRHIFHVGGDVDFDNYYRWLAPWPLLRSQRITVLPAIRTFERGPWHSIANHRLRVDSQMPASTERIETLVKPLAARLAEWPLYISVDKDVLVEADAIVNWDSGHLRLAEACAVLAAFLRAAGGRLAGMDLLGDWSPVHLRGLSRRFFHLTEHPALTVNAEAAARRNEQTNLALLEAVGAVA
jgi:hypothetical protein